MIKPNLPFDQRASKQFWAKKFDHTNWKGLQEIDQEDQSPLYYSLLLFQTSAHLGFQLNFQMLNLTTYLLPRVAYTISNHIAIMDAWHLLVPIKKINHKSVIYQLNGDLLICPDINSMKDVSKRATSNFPGQSVLASNSELHTDKSSCCINF